MGRKHTHYSPEFRAEAVRLAETSGQSIRQVALDLGISNESLRRWIALAHERPAGTPLGADERAELVELRRRVKVLETEHEILRKAAALLRSGDRADPVTRFRFVEQEKARYPVRILCAALGVSPSGYYAWRSRGPSARERSDAALAAEIRRSHAPSRGPYGVPRVHADLADAGFHVSRKRVARLMRRDHLAGVHRRRFVRTTIRDEDAAPFPDLVNRDFSAPGPDRLWVADITALPTRAGPCYLASIVDAWSRRVVGWSMATHMRTEFVTAALDAAIVRRRPGTDLVHHSDHGTQGGFHRSSQHLETEVLRWAFASANWQSGHCAATSGRRAGHRSRGVTTVSGSGERSLAAPRPRRLPPRRRSHRPSGRAGSGRLAACRRSRWPRSRGAI